MPKTLFCLAVSGMALSGIPPLAGFVGKWQIGTAATAAPYGYMGLTALMISALLTVLYIFSILGIATMPGKGFDFKTAHQGVEDPNALMTIPMFVLAAAAILYGLYAGPAIRFFGQIAAGVL